MNSGSPELTPQPLSAMPSVVTGRPQSRIFLGILLAFIGIGLGALGFALSYATSLGAVGTISTPLQLVAIEMAMSGSGSALTGVGLFLVFFNIARIRPATKPWTSVAAFVLLATVPAGLILAGAYFQAWSALVSGASSSVDAAARLVFTISAIRAAVALAGSTAILIGLFGLIRSLSSR